ncbi:MAG: hypothetical protein CMM58_07100 [Rhodospirillaceae bacterium]|nr:hypothetical protein [Rhodospirillaceae bacterium]|tara:strand:- start:2083 stop:2907 length:825 start_codon:yes stop_codon:yes gene_type:complete
MALTQNEEIIEETFPFDKRSAEPKKLRHIFRSGAYRGTTAAMADGYTQGNLAIIPENYALDFARFCQRNPQPCPIIGVSDTGNPEMFTLGDNIDIRSDIPSYNIYRDGKLDSSVSDIRELWQNDSVAFVLGCSFSFEEALAQGQIPLRHVELDRTCPMYKTSIETVPSGPFSGGMVVSMRPMSSSDAVRASAITARFPHTHGMPVHLGDPAEIGIIDINKPDWGDPSEFKEGEIPVFWACGVTPQNAIRNADIPFVITHTPGSMLITDKLSTTS